MNTRFRLVSIAAALCVFGCATNTVYFSEGTVLGFRAEFKPDASEPLSTTLAYKRRIVTVVPPKEPTPALVSDWLFPQQNVHHGEALSVISTFAVDADIKHVAIQNNFLSGVAAQNATRDPGRARATLEAVVNPTAMVPLSENLLQRQDALWAKIGAMSDADAQTLASRLKLSVIAGGKDAKARLNDVVLDARDDASLKRLEDAFNQ